MKRIVLILVGVLLTISIFAGCSGSNEIEIQGFDGETVTISLEDLTDEQITLLEQLANGEIQLQDLMTSDVFTRKELSSLGLTPNMENAPEGMGEGEQMGGGQMMNDYSLADIDIDSLNFEGKSDEVVDAITKAIEDGMTAQELTDEGVVTLDDLMDVGIFQNGDMMGGPEGEAPEGAPEGGGPGGGQAPDDSQMEQPPEKDS